MNNAKAQSHDLRRKMPPPAALRQSGWVLELPVEGHSMDPLLREGDTATVLCGSNDLLKAGDLICFQRDATFVLHRLIERKDDDTWFEKGDAEAGGTWIDADTVVGRVTQVNGVPIHGGRQKQALRISLAERRMVRLLKQMGCPRLPARWAGMWRRCISRYVRWSADG